MSTIQLSVRQEHIARPKDAIVSPQPESIPPQVSTSDQSFAEQPFGPGPDANIARVQQRWNQPGINKYRLAATFISFALVGASDGVYGVSYGRLLVLCLY